LAASLSAHSFLLETNRATNWFRDLFGLGPATEASTGMVARTECRMIPASRFPDTSSNSSGGDSLSHSTALAAVSLAAAATGDFGGDSGGGDSGGGDGGGGDGGSSD
jgi:hypothetical protein